MSAAPIRRPGSYPLRPGEACRLRLSRGASLPVHVAGTGEDLLLVLLVDPGRMFDEEAGNLLLESISSRGVVRIRGTAERIDSDLIRFHVEGRPDILQRRQFVRVVAPQRVTVDDDDGGQIADTRSVNISGGGMLLSGPGSLDLDTNIRFSLYLNELQRPIMGTGRVIRTAEESQRAIVFEEISQADRERLIHFIFDRQRVALAVTRGDTV